MSVLFGAFQRDNKAVESGSIQAIDDALSYWKVDHKGSWHKGAIALGHHMLWNTPESKQERLPHVTHSSSHLLAITIDARLDNRQALAEQLELPDIPLRQVTDSELILAAYQKWGKDCPVHLLGDFTFAIWDEKNQQLFCARDPIGIKPFYYYLSKNLFIFCNDIHGLVAHPEIGKKYNDRSIAMFLAGGIGFYDKQETFFKNILKLPAATSLTISKAHTSESTYWDIHNIPKIQYDTHEEYVQRLSELLHDAVKVRLRTVYPVTAHLSGGLDSSAIAVLAARELKKKQQPLYAFNWVETPLTEHDPNLPEWRFASQLAALENIEQINIELTAEFIADRYDTADISKDDISFYWSEYRVREAAEKLNARSILSGWGGDDLISYDGYAYLSGLFWQGHFVQAIQEISCLYKDANYKYLRIAKRSFREIIYPLFYRQLSGLYQQQKSDANPFEYIQNQFADAARKFTLPKIGIFRPGAHAEQQLLFQQGHILQRIENWASSAFEKKLEYSYPLLDKRIVEFALAIPEHMYARKEGHQRYLFRSAIADFLPAQIVWKEKFLEVEHEKKLTTLYYKSLKIWLKKHGYTQEKQNGYADRIKITTRLKAYFIKNEKKDTLGNIVAAILLLKL